MTQYTVKWEIDIKAETSEDAAKQAWLILKGPNTVATFLNVYAYEKDNSEVCVGIYDMEEI